MNVRQGYQVYTLAKKKVDKYINMASAARGESCMFVVLCYVTSLMLLDFHIFLFLFDRARHHKKQTNKIHMTHMS